MRILIGVDGSAFSDAAVGEVAKRTWPEGSEVLVLHVFELPIVPTPEVWALPEDYYERLENACHKHADTVIKAAVEKLSVLGNSVRITRKVVQGAPRSEILNQAEKWKADLIVVGSHGYPNWERWLLGSVSQAVVAHAKCSVEVVRLPEERKAAA